ncbi:MAG TPA: amidohydrolase family protein [Steroidobacteraceae bacterium]|nr:amidohydrolase family protein [Steroidobacteraceae bacterium]
MTLTRLCALALVIAVRPAAAAAPMTACTAFVDVSVVETSEPRVQSHRTVVVRSERIEGIYTASDPVPSTCLRIAGEGRFLIPGLTDSHLHLFGYSRGGEGDPATEGAILRMMLANGVTTAVVMEGSPATVHLRDEIRARRVFGPTLYSAGPLIQAPNTGELPGRRTFQTPVEVTREVEEEKHLGYDFVKVHGAMPAATYAALLAASRRAGLPVIGHIPDNLGVDAALNGGQKMIAHAESYLQTYFEFGRQLPSDPAEIGAMVRNVAARTARSGAFVQPTLSVFRQIITQVADADALLQRPQMRLLPPIAIRDWQPDRNPYLRHWSYGNLDHFKAEYRVMQRLVRGMRDAGVPILVGTDDLVPMQLPGFAVKEEMEEMEEAGLTPFEVLKAATATSARFLGTQHHSGAVRAGYDADLVLLDANPLEDISNAFRQAGVMVHGHWLTEACLQRALRDRTASRPAEISCDDTNG